ncbi:hypothetical protein PYR67_20340 [Rhizobium sp. BC49]|nr:MULTISPECIES: hypothetical protein [unclassified Rhizobium]MDF0661673.1 hypothetical protein [Rhizobium sp. BC49]
MSVALRIIDREMLKPEGSLPRWRCPIALPSVEPNPVMIADGRQNGESSQIKVEIKAQNVAINAN